MSRILRVFAFLLLLPVAAIAATRKYDLGAFEAVYVAAGVEVEITLGTTRSVVAETRADNFDDLRIAVEGNVLKIDRPSRGWFMLHRPSYTVQVATPVLKSLKTSSGAEAMVKGPLTGDLDVDSSSGSEVHVSAIQGGKVKARVASGSDVELTGTCSGFEAEATSGSDLDARGLRCETATVQTSSGSDVAVFATRSVKGKASSGSDVKISGAPPLVQVDKSSGADVTMAN